MDAIILMAGAISVLTAAFVQFVKSTINIPKKYLPIVALAIGILMGLMAWSIPELRTDLSFSAYLLGGALSGLSASGLYDLSAKTIIDKESEKNG